MSDQMREAFEQWFADSRRGKGVRKAETLLNRAEDDTYADISVQRHWWTWQSACAWNARAAAAVQPVAWRKPETGEVASDVHVQSWRRHFGKNGIEMAKGYTEPLYAAPQHNKSASRSATSAGERTC